jgi:hypothetical protein
MQPLFALDQRPRGKALAVQIEEVEGEEDEAVRPPLIHRGLQQPK